MEITVIDESGTVGWLASATRFGEVYMTSVASLVTRVSCKLDGRKMTRLNVLDHGNENVVQFGKDRINVDNFKDYEPLLAKLKPHFASFSSAHLQHCRIGENYPLLRMFAATWGVPVYAGTGKHNPVYRINFGEYVRCTKDGLCATGVSRP